MLGGGRVGEGIVGELGMDTHAAILDMDNQQGRTAQCRELCSKLRGSLQGEGAGGDGYVYMYG